MMATATKPTDRKSVEGKKLGLRGESPTRDSDGRRNSKNKKRTPPKQAAAQAPSPQALKPLHVESADILSMHAQCGAARYKVHRPGCSCPKMEHARARPIIEGNNGDDLSQRMADLNLCSTNLFDNLIVAPDTKNKNPPALFACLNTSDSKYSMDPMGCEEKLQKEIFGENNKGTDKLDPTNLPSFKVSCASCLLEGNPNGFVCLAFSKEGGILKETIKEAAEIAASRQQQGQLHHDHAHGVCTLSLDSLRMLGKQPKSHEVKLSVLSQLQQGGIQIDCVCNGILSNSSDVKVKMGHHLSTLLQLVMAEDYQDDSFLPSLTHWMVLVYKAGAQSWTLDLPGGKRHLGESTMDCAIRETQEECSVTVNPAWMSGEQARKVHDGSSNLFYVLEPSS